MKKLALSCFLVGLTHSAAAAQTHVWERETVGDSFVGVIFGSLASGGDGSFWTRERIWGATSVTHSRLQRYGSDGGLLFSTDPAQPGNDFITTLGISPDGSGGLHIVGYRYLPNFQRSLGNGRMDASGQIVWQSALPTGGTEVGYGTVSDGAGGNYLVGTTDTGATSGMPVQGTDDALIARFDSNGQLLWGWSSGVPNRSSIMFNAVGDGSGGVIAVGTRTLGSTSPPLIARLTGAGAELWTATFPGAPRPVAVASDGAGGVGFVGTLANEGWVGHVDPSGVLDWSTSLPQLSVAGGLVRLDGGDWLASGYQGAWDDVERTVLVRLSATGAILSTRVLDEMSLPRPDVSAMLLDEDGNLILGGTRRVPGSFEAYRSWLGRVVVDELSAARCSGTTNSTGSPAVTAAHGSSALGDNRVTLYSSGLPPQATAIFLTSQSIASVPNPGGADGTLCLGGTIGRYVRPGEVLQSDDFGRIHLGIDTSDMPLSFAGTAVMSGDEWHFQSWYRDVATFAGSNFSSSASIVLQ